MHTMSSPSQSDAASHEEKTQHHPTVDLHKVDVAAELDSEEPLSQEEANRLKSVQYLAFFLSFLTFLDAR